MIPNRSQHSALNEIDSRIVVLERRLRNARAARDSYVDYLRGKYPDWRPSLPTYERKLNRDDNLVSYLATSSYHWEGNRRTIPRPSPLPPRLYNEIPKRGPFLDSDFTRTRERLGLLSQQLRILRNHRMNVSTEDYFRTKGTRMREISYENEEIPSLNEVRKRLADMSFSSIEPPSTVTVERIEELQRIEAREKMIQDIKAGILPPSSKEPKSILKIDEPEPVQSTIVKTAAPAVQTTAAQPRIQFSESKPIPTPNIVPPLQSEASPIISSSKPPTAPSTPPKHEEPSGSSAYSRIMGIITKSDSEESDDTKNRDTSIKPKPGLVIGSLSQYLKKSIDTIPSESKSAPKASMGFGVGEVKKKTDSDSDDFFD